MRTLFVLFLTVSCLCQNVIGQDSTLTLPFHTIKGKVIDLEFKEPLMFATITLYKSGSKTLLADTETDLDGNYKFVVEAGTYDIKVSYPGYSTLKKTGITINQSTVINLRPLGGTSEEEVIIITTCEPIIRHDKTTSGRTYTARDIENMPVKW